MQLARKLNACTCGAQTETVCEGCGTPVCRQCSHQEISSKDLRLVTVSTFCANCKEDPKKNIWGTLYWDRLVSLYN
jgi:hypothetical protein